ncbi:MAG: hypothetical protein HY901_18680, partial [Deltaproteobacteria bacterium]|nr:hypothetical protein [Deltaproteobacteria bacterium]
MSCSSAQLAEVTAKVLEEAAFLSAEPDEGLEAGRGSEPELVAQLTFGPPLGGWMRLEASRALAMTL